MKNRTVLFGVVLIAVIAAGVWLLAGGEVEADTLEMSGQATSSAVAELHDAEGRSVGRAKLSSTDRGVMIELEVRGLPEGRHGFHIHEVGLCEPDDAFTTAGGHFNPGKKKHGMENPDGPHAGDLPNIVVASDGTGRLTVVNPYLSLGTGDKFDLLYGDGTTVMIHAGPDDYFTDPAGDSGARIACGIVTPAS